MLSKKRSSKKISKVKKVSRVSSVPKKALRFNKVLLAAKDALDAAKVQFHLHAGTALGAHREKSFIPHDHDIDLAVFYKDVNTQAKVKTLISSMEDHGFTVLNKLGKPGRGFEIQFEKNDIPLDIFWVYEGKYRGKKYHIVSSYYGTCDKLPHKACIWGYRPYRVQNIKFLGATYKTVPKSTLVDMYGKDWTIKKKYNYFQGITEGLSKGEIKDYYHPRPVKKIAFCFLMYNFHNHSEIWENFFQQDRYPIKNYSIYTHPKEITDKTPEWVSKNAIKTIKTDWCDESLFFAWVNMLKKALRDPDNKYFALLSGDCVPLYSLETVHKKITKSKKSMLNISPNSYAFQQTGLDYADQWMILNRKHAKLLLDLKISDAGKKFRAYLKKRMCSKDGEECMCPDEIYPANWFMKNYGHYTSTRFKNEFRVTQSTYTYWKGDKPHPVKFDKPTAKKFKSKICKSSSVFARKFKNGAAILCKEKERKKSKQQK